MSCTLRELAQLLTMALPNIMPDPSVGTRLGFRLVFPDVGAGMERGGGRLEREELGRGRWVVRDVGEFGRWVEGVGRRMEREVRSRLGGSWMARMRRRRWRM